MGCSSDFVQYVVGQCSGAGDVAVRKMMEDYLAALINTTVPALRLKQEHHMAYHMGAPSFI